MSIESINEITNQLTQVIQTAPSLLSGVILFFVAWIEYVFPIFPGDTLMIAGGFFAARGAISLYVVFIALVLGSVSGSITCWALGNGALKYRFSKRIIYFFVTDEHIEHVKIWYKRYGNWVLIFNRFMLGIRSAFMFVSGIAKLPLRQVLLWGTVSALLWNSLLIYAGYLFNDNLDSLLEWFAKYTEFVFMVFGFIIVLLLIRLLFKKRTY